MSSKLIYKLFYLYCFVLLVRFLVTFTKSISLELYTAAFQDFTISDWLINYEAGFVRRGLWGSIFLKLYELFGINPGPLIYVLSYLFLFLFVVLFIKKWRNYKLSLFLLPSIWLIGAFAKYNLLWFRRDILIFLLIWLAFICYRSYIEGKKSNIVWLYLVSIFTILSHEASFFYFVPIICLHYILVCRCNLSWMRSIVNTLIFCLPMLFAMFLCSYFKGNAEMAEKIWHSWDPYFMSEFGKILPIGEGTAALGWDGLETFRNHLALNYFSKTSGVYKFMILPFIYIGVYYLLVRPNNIKIGVNSNGKYFSSNIFSKILLLQFVFLLPMFTVLSCDLGRVVLYWTISSFLFYFSLDSKSFHILFKRKNIGINWMNLQYRLVYNKCIYLIIYIFLSIDIFIFTIKFAFFSSVLGDFYVFINYLIKCGLWCLTFLN